MPIESLAMGPIVPIVTQTLHVLTSSAQIVKNLVLQGLGAVPALREFALDHDRAATCLTMPDYDFAILYNKL